jgi:hypothetical protein
MDVDRLFREGVEALRAGDRATARAKLTQAVQQDELYEEAWLWLSGAVEDDEERAICLENVLTINPYSEPARAGLRKLGRPVPPLPQPDPSPPPPQEPESYRPPPPPPPGPDAIEQGSTRSLDHDLRARLAGIDPEALPASPPTRREVVQQDESWRAELLDKAYVGSDATLVPGLEPPPKRDLFDLVNVWLDMTYLNTFGGFDDEIRYGGIGHVLVNIVAGGLLQLLASLMLVGLLALLPALNVQPPLLRSLADLVAGGLPQGEITPDLGESSSFLGTLQEMGMFEVTVDMGDLPAVEEEVGSGLEDVASMAALAGVVGTGLLIYGVLAIPILLVTWLWTSLVVNQAAVWLGGKGDAIRTMQALTIALAVTQLVRLPAFLVIPFVSVWWVLAILAVLWVYQNVVAATALGRVHGFGLFASLGVLILASGAANFAMGMAFSLLTSISGVL